MSSPKASEPTLALLGVEVGTVQALTNEGSTRCLVLRMVGTEEGSHMQVARRVAVAPEDVGQFLSTIVAEARKQFPDQVPPTL